RTLFSIIQNCLTTIFLCTWVSVHLNVPPAGLGLVAGTWRKLQMLLITLIAPELMFGFAARQYLVAKWIAKSQCVSLLLKYSLSATQGFFFVMGGFVTPGGGRPIVTEDQLGRYLDGIGKIKDEIIKDKSKNDRLSKLWTLVHVVCFATYCVARLKERLPISRLETATVGFAIIHSCTYVCWMKKPRDV
ncbi:hypothetical protein K438DRAFT_1435554, partial [Mycena galopus ATCC 62051]